MTASIAQFTNAEKARRRAQPQTLAEALGAAFLAAADVADVPSWPSAQYETDPVGFARDVLGADLLTPQAKILAALATPNARVTVSSGHRAGKDYIASLAACWFFCSFERARVLLTAPTARQINGITYREVRLRTREAKIPILGEGDRVGELAATGVVASDLREIRGFSAKKGEAVTGIAAPHLLFVATEASGVEDELWDAFRGNLAGADARVLLISNPTRRRGFFFDSFNVEPKDKQFAWSRHPLSSWDIAREQELRGRIVGGLATTRWCEEMRSTLGEKDPRYRVRVLGEFVDSEEDRAISLSLIAEAQQRWESTPVLPADPLYVGVDPAYGGRDETAVALRRGRKVLAVHRFQEGDTKRAADIVATFIGAELRPGESGCVVRSDRGGELGWKFVRDLRAAMRVLDPSGTRITVKGISFSDPVRRVAQFIRLRDELWITLKEWLSDGGAIPSDDKLEDDLLAPKLTQHDNGKISVEPKESIRKRLNRSTDSADAVILSVWSHADTSDVRGSGEPAPQVQEAAPAAHDEPSGFDPYSGAISPWGGR